MIHEDIGSKIKEELTRTQPGVFLIELNPNYSFKQPSKVTVGEKELLSPHYHPFCDTIPIIERFLGRVHYAGTDCLKENGVIVQNTQSMTNWILPYESIQRLERVITQ
nr:hypothetical protein [Nanoarchaeum sp.]